MSLSFTHPFSVKQIIERSAFGVVFKERPLAIDSSLIRLDSRQVVCDFKSDSFGVFKIGGGEFWGNDGWNGIEGN